MRTSWSRRANTNSRKSGLKTPLISIAGVLTTPGAKRIAPNYRKFDLLAVRMMGANIELWTYRLEHRSIVPLNPTDGAADYRVSSNRTLV